MEKPDTESSLYAHNVWIVTLAAMVGLGVLFGKYVFSIMHHLYRHLDPVKP